MQKTPPLSKYSKKILIPNFFCLQVSRNKWKKEEEEKMWIIKRKTVYHNKTQPLGLLICTLISENQGLEKSRSASNPRKISGPAHLNLFFLI